LFQSDRLSASFGEDVQHWLNVTSKKVGYLWRAKFIASLFVGCNCDGFFFFFVMPKGHVVPFLPGVSRMSWQDFGLLWQYLMPFIVDCWRECFAVQTPFLTTRLPWFNNLIPCVIWLYYISKTKHHSYCCVRFLAIVTKESHCELVYRFCFVPHNTGSGRQTWQFLSYNKMKSVLSFYVRAFITKIIFIWKHFNYNIHFLNIVSVRWCPLLSAHSRKRRTSDKSLAQWLDVLSSYKWRLSSWTFSFCGRRCFSEVSHPQQYSTATRDTVVLMNIEVPMKYPLSHNDRFVVLEVFIHSESRRSTDQHSMATEMLWVSLEGRSVTNSPLQWFHSQLCCQMVSYLCWTLYKSHVYVRYAWHLVSILNQMLEVPV